MNRAQLIPGVASQAYVSMRYLRFSIRSILLLTLVVAINLLYVSRRNDLAVYIPWSIGATIGYWRQQGPIYKRILGAAWGGVVGAILVIPTVLVCELTDRGIPINSVSKFELIRYLVQGTLLLVFVALIGGAAIGLILWPIVSLTKLYMNVVDRMQYSLLIKDTRDNRSTLDEHELL